MGTVRNASGTSGRVWTGPGRQGVVRTYAGDPGDGGKPAIPLDLEPLAVNAQAIVVTNSNIAIYNRNQDGTLGDLVNGDAGNAATAGVFTAPVAGTWTNQVRVWASDTTDVEWILPGHPLNPQTRSRIPLDRGLVCEGGRNHRMLYAVQSFSRDWLKELHPTATGQNDPDGTGYYAHHNRAFDILNYTGVWDIAYAHLFGPFQYEHFNLSNTKALNGAQRFRMRRSRLDGHAWLPKAGHDGGDHGVQTWNGPNGTVEFDSVTMLVGFQSLFLAGNDLGVAAPSAVKMRKVNVETTNSDTIQYYNLKNNGDATAVPPTTLDRVVLTDLNNPARPWTGSNRIVSTKGIEPVSGTETAGQFAGLAYCEWTDPTANTTGRIYQAPHGLVEYAPANKVGFDADPTWTGWL